ncbi:hypothetical protein RAS1_14680 [Phycisphaerae bacterium RAS1]|nr:hypothetical protein RAS1_14680 [Phycisphaerae bacterium RAS1]
MNGQPTDYEILAHAGEDQTRGRGREFYYDADGGRYMSREMVVRTYDPMQWEVLPEQPQRWTDLLGLLPYGDFELSVTDDLNCDTTTGEPVEKMRYLSDNGLMARYEVGTIDGVRYLNPDMIGSISTTTDIVGEPTGQQAYTAFGEPLVWDAQASNWRIGTTLPGSIGRYGYVGKYGYESDMLVLDGAPGTAPITLSHVGARWYQASVGRFVQRDPIGLTGGANLYLYAGANPVSQTDPFGTEIIYVGDPLPTNPTPYPVHPGGRIRIPVNVRPPVLPRPPWWKPVLPGVGTTAVAVCIAAGLGYGTGVLADYLTERWTGRSLGDRIGEVIYDWFPGPFDREVRQGMGYL